MDIIPSRDLPAGLEVLTALALDLRWTWSYAGDAQGLPRGWVARIRASMARLAPQFSSNRMVREYVERMYLPAAAAYQRRSADHGQLAKELYGWWTALQAHWHEVHFSAVEVSRDDEDWAFRVRVYLGEIPAASVRVEVYANPLGEEEPLRMEMERGDAIPGAVNGDVYHARIPTSRPAEDFTPRVVPYHPEARVPMEAPLICWQR